MVTVEGYIRMCGKMCSKARQVLKTKDDPENEREREREMDTHVLQTNSYLTTPAFMLMNGGRKCS